MTGAGPPSWGGESGVALGWCLVGAPPPIRMMPTRSSPSVICRVGLRGFIGGMVAGALGRIELLAAWWVWKVLGDPGDEG